MNNNDTIIYRVLFKVTLHTQLRWIILCLRAQKRTRSWWANWAKMEKKTS